MSNLINAPLEEPARSAQAGRFPHGAPVGFEKHAIERRYDVEAPARSVWSWLQDPATFTHS